MLRRVKKFCRVSKRFALVCLGGLLVLLCFKHEQTIDGFRIAWKQYQSMANPPQAMPGPIKVAEGADPEATLMIWADDAGRSWDKFLKIMQKRRLPCIQSVITMRVGENDRSKFLTWDEIEEAHRWGCDMYPHSVWHNALTKVPPADAMKELVDSRRILQQHLGGPPSDVFVTPEGDYDQALIEMMKKAGYKAHVEAYGGETGKRNDARWGFAPVGLLSTFLITRYEVKNYRTAEEMCNVVKGIVGKRELLILVYHESQERPAPEPPAEYKTKASIKGSIPPEYHVFVDVYADTMDCIAKLRDEGKIRVESSLMDAIEFYNRRREMPDERELGVVALARKTPDWALPSVQQTQIAQQTRPVAPASVFAARGCGADPLDWRCEQRSALIVGARAFVQPARAR